MDAFRKTEKEIDKEIVRATEICYYTSCIVLKRHYGWGKQRTTKFIESAKTAFDSGKEDMESSLIEICDKEVGVEIRISENESYTECPFLCKESYKKYKEKMATLSELAQNCTFIRERQKFKKWILAQVLASVMIGLYRKEGWASGRIQKFMEYFEETRNSYGNKASELKRVCKEECDMEFFWQGNAFGLKV